MCSAITLGRVAWVCPGQIAPHLAHFAGPWCYALRNIRDDVEKEHAFLGLCALLRANPEVAVATALQHDRCNHHTALPPTAGLQLSHVGKCCRNRYSCIHSCHDVPMMPTYTGMQGYKSPCW